ncbi:unnamed protein product, partial [Gulo gulo]
SPGRQEIQEGTRWVEWGSLPAGKQVNLRKNAGRGEGKRGSQPSHLTTKVLQFLRERNTQPEKKFGDLWFEKLTPGEQEFVSDSPA